MKAKDDRITLMREGSVPSTLLKLGLPTMIGMLVSALYNVVDAYFVGRLGTSQMGAVSIVFPVAQVIIGLGMMFGSGAASYLARLLGGRKTETADAVASTAVFTSVLAGAVVIGLSLCVLDPLLVSLGATQTILPYARAYAVIYLAGSVIQVFNVTMNNIVTAEGATRLTMASMLLGCGLNAVLDPLFIYTFGWGIRGAAIATVAAQCASTALYVRYLAGRRGALRFSLRNLAFSGETFAQIFKVGVPTLLFQLLTSVSIGLTNTAASRYGDAAVAAMGIVTRLMAMGTFVMFGYMKGFQPFAGYNYGAGQYERLREAIRVSLIWASCFCAAVALLLFFASAPIMGAFTRSDPLAVTVGSRALRANAIPFLFFGFQMVYAALFLALGRGREGALLSISRQGLFFIPAILTLPRFFGLDGVIFTQPVADTLTVIVTALFAFRLSRELSSPRSRDSEEKRRAVADGMRENLQAGLHSTGTQGDRPA